MNKNNIKYLVLSDIHLGHSINRTEYIINNLNKFFLNNHNEFKELDMICIAGDIFDKLLINSSKDYILSVSWLTELIMYCKKYNIMLRILEGTPSHDWKQAKLISSLIEKLNIEIDYKYIDTLYIEKNDKLGISILYLPDEYNKSAEKTFKEVKLLLKKNKLLKVDIAFIHGQFHYQLPMVKLESSHSMEDYLNIVKYYISIGHIHTSSVYERIIAQGSFDRLAHNEEEDKGGVLINIYKDGSMDFKFLKNHNAMVFNTYRFDKEGLKEIIKKIDKEVKKLPDNSNIRIISNNEDFLSKNIKDIRDRYFMYNVKVDKPKVKEETKFTLLANIKKIDTFHITPDNILSLMTDEAKKYHNLDKGNESKFKEEIETVIKELLS